MIYTVTCDTCGKLISTGMGSAQWERPHGTCPATTVTVVWTYVVERDRLEKAP